MAKTIIMSLYKSSRWCKLLIIMLIILVFFVGFNSNTKVEGFINQTEKFSFIKGPKIFDNFYSSIYDDIITDNVKDEYQIGKIINDTSPSNSSFILDVGSGTGNIVSLFNQKKIKAIGLDNSTSMINISKQKFPSLEFNYGNATNVMLYPAHTFTHITCLNNTIYYMKDKSTFIKNVYEWLAPGGYLILGLDNNKTLRLTNKNRNVFTNFSYKSQIQRENGEILINETFKDEEGKVRKQQHKLFYNSSKNILQDAQYIGFIVNGEFTLSPVNYSDKRIYILYKPE